MFARSLVVARIHVAKVNPTEIAFASSCDTTVDDVADDDRVHLPETHDLGKVPAARDCH